MTALRGRRRGGPRAANTAGSRPGGHLTRSGNPSDGKGDPDTAPPRDHYIGISSGQPINLRFSKVDGSVKRPTAALRFIFRRCDVLSVRLTPQASSRKAGALFTKPSNLIAKAECVIDNNGTRPV